ncbi:MAG: PAS domain S-box protein [Verrucomicrobia bacterium]|nr:PAS domain S-box protein [Verrucomicrobiota bacterium]
MNRFSSTDASSFDPSGTPPRIIELIRTAYWDWRLAEDAESLSDGFAEMFGRTADDLPEHPRAWRKFLAPEDAPRLEESFRRHVESRGKIPFREEARYSHASGASAWVICTGQVIDWGPNGEPLRMTGTHTDVSALRTQKLRHELVSLVAAHTIHAVVITDSTGLIEWVNQSFTRITGYTLDEVRGKKPGQVLQRAGSDFQAVSRIRQAIAAGQSCEETLTNYTKAGEPYIVHIKIDPVRDKDGNVTHFIAVQTDVTEQVKAQRAVEQSEVRLRAVLDSATGVAIVAIGLDGVITYFSRGAEALLGYKAEEVVGRHTPEIFHDPVETESHSRRLLTEHNLDVSGFRTFVALAEKNGIDRREWSFLCKDGSRKAVEMNVTVVRDENGEARSYLGTAMDITQRKDMERELRHSEQRFRGMFELSPVGISFNAMDGAFLDINRALLDSLGYTREELLQMTYWDLTPKEYMALEETQIAIIRQTGRYGPYEKEFYHRDGHRVSALLHGVVLQTPGNESIICSIVQDITETKRTERELRHAVEAQKAAYTLLEAAGRLGRVGHWEWRFRPFSVFWSDIMHDIHETDPAIPPEPDMLATMGQIVANDRSRVQALVEDTVRTGKPLDIETQVITTSGRAKWVHCRAELLRDENGRAAALRGVLQDIDDRRRAAELLEQRNRELEAATARAEAHARAKEEFLANVSHEIRTPLNAVIGMSELLSGANLLPHERELVDTIHSSGNTLLALINDILDFSKIESGQLDLETIKVDLRDCLESAMEVMATTAAGKKLDLVCQIRPDVPEWIRGDPTRLRQVFVNLLSNAVKFTTEGEVVATLDLRHAPSGQPMIHCSVHDTGIGIPHHRMMKLFQAFSQVDASTTRRYGGTGLGLVICHRLIEKMGGRIWVDSEYGRGSIFQFEIPAVAVNAPPRRQLDTSPLRGLRILIADDNAASCEIYRAQAEECGMKSRVTSSAEETLEALRCNEPYDLVLADSAMRTSSGEGIVVGIRALRREIPIVALSPMGGKPDSVKSSDHTAVLSRPVRKAALASTMVRLLGGVSGEGESHSARPEATQGSQYPLRILVAEDNPVNQRVTQLMLNRIGYEATIVANGIEVLQMLEKFPFDVVLLDVQMPEMDGLQAAREIRKRTTPEFHPWLIALTANAEESDRTACLEAGMDDYMSKPVGLESLKNALSRAYHARCPLPPQK